MLNIIVKNRQDIQNGFCPDDLSVLITITDPSRTHADPSDRYNDVLYLKFDDADFQVVSSICLINNKHANIILNFVAHNIECNIKTIVVNCEAGISRSAGVAAALSKIYNGCDKDIIKMKPMYNRKVYSTILECYHDVS